MINANEARENMKKYEDAQRMAQLARVSKWLESIEKRIIHASTNGNDNIAVSDMEMLTDSMMACEMLRGLGYVVTRISERDALKISWSE